ncbi:MAG TPA: small acid-soluble spore protein SspI [Pseudogracilibacillus sp.]|nr:small acid-soluble spore protein SspI [Pseudogracilibacillus sp.]
MDIDLRKAILHNIKENTPEELEATIVDAISLGEEKVLPGLGYLFEMIWKQSEEKERAKMIEALADGVKEEQQI